MGEKRRSIDCRTFLLRGSASSRSTVIGLQTPIVLVYRIMNEEEVLLRELPGYREYTEKVRYRLIPGIW